MEHWHPNPAFFYQKGADLVLDLGPYNIASLTAINFDFSRSNDNDRIKTWLH
jgi:hypothetical protein